MDSSPYIEKIKSVRRLKRLTQQDMADRLGFNDVKEYGRVETGEKRLTLDLLEAIAEVFELSVTGLLGFDEKMIFDHCTQDHSMFGNSNQYHEANAALFAEMKERIKHLEEEVTFLRRQLEHGGQ
jgi:transcriptional regulator with XRE-family HTH domain